MSTTQPHLLPEYTSWSHPQRETKISIRNLQTAMKAKFGKLPIEIVLAADSERDRSYSTNDEIGGQVILMMEKILDIIDLGIVLEGTTATYVEDHSVPTQYGAYYHGRHTFLRVAQNVDKDQLAHDNDEDSNAVRSFPFKFVVPDRLLPHICSHKIEHPEVRNAHLYLPPTLGDYTCSRIQMDDMAPAMVKISYAIKVRAIVRNSSGNVVDLAERTRKVRIVPAREEQPPMIINEQYSEFCLLKLRHLKRGFFKRSYSGRLAVELTQPRSFRLPPPGEQISNETTTTTNIVLRFDPHDSVDNPPRLHSIFSKIRVYTFFGAGPYDVLPLPLPRAAQFQNWSNMHGLYSRTIKLSSRCLSAVAWERHDKAHGSDPMEAKPVALPGASSIFYTTTLKIPVSLPNGTGNKRARTFVPSFHSCNVSRCYSLKLRISFSSAGGSIFASHVNLISPVQISSYSLRS